MAAVVEVVATVGAELQRVEEGGLTLAPNLSIVLSQPMTNRDRRSVERNDRHEQQFDPHDWHWTPVAASLHRADRLLMHGASFDRALQWMNRDPLQRLKHPVRVRVRVRAHSYLARLHQTRK